MVCVLAAGCANILHLGHKLEAQTTVPPGFVCGYSLEVRWPAADLSGVPSALVDSGLCLCLPQLVGPAKARGLRLMRCVVGALGAMAQWANCILDGDVVDAAVKALPEPVP